MKYECESGKTFIVNSVFYIYIFNEKGVREALVLIGEKSERCNMRDRRGMVREMREVRYTREKIEERER